jgi:16S rRNA (cytosine1402-N4)-methyltransferase
MWPDMSEEQHIHETVLLQEAVDLLVTDPAGIYVDATFGRGGHSAVILSKIGNDGSLLAIDKDLDAIDVANERFADESRF